MKLLYITRKTNHKLSSEKSVTTQHDSTTMYVTFVCFFPSFARLCASSLSAVVLLCVSLCFRDTEQLSSRNRNHSSTVMILELAPKREGNGSGAAIYLQNIPTAAGNRRRKKQYSHSLYSLTTLLFSTLLSSIFAAIHPSVVP